MALENFSDLTFRDIIGDYSDVLLAVLAGFVLAIALFLGYNYYTEERIIVETKRTQLYLESIAKEGEKPQVTINNLKGILTDLGDPADSAYPNLTHFHLAKLYLQKENYMSAIDSLRLIIKDPYNDYFQSLAAYRLASLHLNRNQIDIAKNVVDSVEWLEDFTELVYNLRGNINYQEKEYKMAMEYWQKALDESSDELKNTYYKIKISDAISKLTIS